MPQAINDLRNYYQKMYKAKGSQLKTPYWPPKQIKVNTSLTLITYKNGRTHKELFEIAKHHKEGATPIDDMVLSESEAKGSRLCLGKAPVIYLWQVLLSKKKAMDRPSVS